MQITSPPSIVDDPGLDNWLRELWVLLLTMPASDVVPASSADTGVKGQMAFDDDFIYICTNKNEWRRANIAVW